jgi:mycothiol system anti-sigma-R factor
VSCEVKNKSLHGYLDGELDVVRAAEFEQHLETCPECLAELESQESLRASLQQAQLREKSPAALRKRVLHELPKSVGTSQFAAPRSWQWLAIAAALLLLVAAASWRVLAIRTGATAQAGLSAEIIDAHVRSLQPGHLVDVLSTDQHTVKPWFNGKMDFAVPVHDFSDEGFPLQGGRLDVIQGRTVAALIYGRRKHEVNLFIWPENGSGDENARSSSSRGYQWISWRKGGMEYWLVSDLGLPDLEILQHLVAQ